MADIQYPSTLPNFRMGKRRTQQQTYRTSQPFAGPLYIEQITDESPVSWDVTITCTSQTQSEQFQAFLRMVKNGEPFDKYILTEEGAILHEVRFVEMPLQPTQINDFLWEYSGLIYAVALIQPNDVVDDSLVANWLQDASIIDNALNNLWGVDPYLRVSNPLSSLFVDGQAVGNLPNGTITTNRATTATYIKSGLLLTAAINELRMNEKGALLEGASTNLALWTTDYQNAAWNTPVGTGSANFVTGDSGANSVQFIAASERPSLRQLLTLTTFTEYTLSVFVEDVTSIGSDDAVLAVNGFTGAIGVISAKISDAVNGVISITFTTDSDATGAIDFGLGILTNATGDVTLSQIQLKLGTFVDSYIPTAATAVTRSVDDVSTLVLNNVPALSQSWSFSCDLTEVPTDGDRTIFNFFGPSELILTNGTLLLKGDIGSVSFAAGLTGNEKIVVTYNGTTATGYIDGLIGLSGLISFTDIVVGNINYGSRTGIVKQPMYGYQRNTKWFDVELTAAEVNLL